MFSSLSTVARSTTTVRRLLNLVVAILFALGLIVPGCGGGDDEEDKPDCSPASGERCACDADDPTSCPGGFLCRPSGDGHACVPEGTAGRIPSCLDPNGLDVFAAEADSALSVSWKVNGALDSTAGFEVRYGSAAGDYTQAVTVGPEVRRATIAPLDNGKAYFVVVAALDVDRGASFVSCEIEAIPHVLAFAGDVVVNATSGGEQRGPDLASNLDGTRLYLAWEDKGAVALAISTDFGDGWIVTELVAASGQAPALAVRDAVIDDAGNVLKPELLYLSWEDDGQIIASSYDPVATAFSKPVGVATGTSPDIALGLDSVHVAFADGDTIRHAASFDGAATFGEPAAVSVGLTNARAPSVAVHPTSGDVLVAWDAIEGAGDSNVYSAVSADGGTTFGTPVRIDDDPMGQNQLNVSIAADPQTGELFASWEDRRGGANVYFATSDDGGQSWSPNVDVGAGLGGDQFHPQAVVDVASNVYVAFQDTTDGQKVVFSRFNEEGTFDPPLAPSTKAGQEGIVGDYPSVATDLFGTVYVAWEENRGGPDLDVVFARAE
ncbi:sialidase family protein [Sorangium sp. So ce1078]|uniref:sialidase family protein n=1 Tax=Sorangium sp. So ce1078 TaxID=3133329 RepID=UPI003F5E3211